MVGWNHCKVRGGRRMELISAITPSLIMLCIILPQSASKVLYYRKGLNKWEAKTSLLYLETVQPMADATADENEQFTEREHRYMDLAFEQAELALERKEVPVGCVFVYIQEDGDEQVIAKAGNLTNETKNATTHAEIVSIDHILRSGYAPEVFRSCELYVTVEPCIMCAGALAQLQLRKAYFGCGNDRFGGCGSVLGIHDESILPSPPHTGFSAVGGLGAERAVEILKRFYSRDNTKAPVGKRRKKEEKQRQDMEV